MYVFYSEISALLVVWRGGDELQKRLVNTNRKPTVANASLDISRSVPTEKRRTRKKDLELNTLLGWFKIYIIKNGFCFLFVCPNTCHASISQPISKLSTSTDSPGTGVAVKNTLGVIGAQTKKF